jgi:hypothetical protein
MDFSKAGMTTLEKKIVAIYSGLVIAIYLLGLIMLNIYTTRDSSVVTLVVAIIVFPVSIYSAIRLTIGTGSKWYGGIFYFLMVGAWLMFSCYYTCMKTDLLLAAILKPKAVEAVTIEGVEKSYVRRNGWVHTNIRLLYKQHEVTFEGSRTSFFLLQNRKQLSVTTGESFTGNYFITNLHLPSSDRWAARLAYFKDWTKRHLWIPIAIAVIILAIWVRTKFWPDVKPIQLSWQRVVLMSIGITAAILLCIYLALIVYIYFMYRP